MRRRRGILLASAALALVPRIAFAEVRKSFRIGYMSLQSRDSESARIGAFLEGLRDLGYAEGGNISIQFRHADGNAARLAQFAKEFVRLKLDAIVSVGTPATLAAMKATATIPIVFPLSGDPASLVASLARPGGNVTGLATLTGDLGRKRLQLLKETVPNLTRVAVLANPDNPVHIHALEEVKAGAASLGLTLLVLQVKAPQEFAGAFKALREANPQALFLLPDEMFLTQRKRVNGFAIENRLPGMFYAREWVEDGGLLFYGAHVPDLFRRAASYVDKILKGAKPSDLPVEQADKFELAVNLRTAKAIGVAVPQSVLLRADRVIE
jgi:putative ABC transport system substrate-binding protein